MCRTPTLQMASTHTMDLPCKSSKRLSTLVWLLLPLPLGLRHLPLRR